MIPRKTKNMIIFISKIAGQVVRVNTIHKSTKKLCAEYLCEGDPLFSVITSPGDIAWMREKAVREDILEGKEPQEYSDAYLETLAVYRKICEAMVDFDTVLMHGSVVAVDGVAYLFTAKSGTGKSTHTKFWRELFGERAVMVNDDKPLLKLTEDGVLACGTPWDGKHRLSTNVCLPLKAVCILERGETDEIHRISAQEALPMVFQQTYRPKKLAKYMEIIDKLMSRVEFYRLKCTMSPNAAKVAYEGMNSPQNT